MKSLFDWSRTILLLGGWLGALVFVVYYHCTARWYRDPLSRYLMSGPLGLFCLYTSAMINMFVTNEIVRDIFRFVMVLSAFLFAWYSVLTYRRARKDVRAHRKILDPREEDHGEQ
jgi:hypothetical protein